jgi:flagellin-like protein
MRNLKNKKALSPVVASIILIAVTVAVSIAVAAWMGALSIGFMQTEQISITKCTFETDNGDPTSEITLTLRNTGTSDVVINSATVNGNSTTIKDKAGTEGTEGPVKVPKNADANVTLNIGTYKWQAGYSYQIKLMSTKGNYFVYNAVAPD